MRYGIISDLHANEIALRTVLAVLDREELDAWICLGDLVGYNARPRECVGLIRERQIPSLAGNHDRLATGRRVRRPDEPKYQSTLWAGDALSPDESAFLNGLPEQRILDERYLAVHGSPRDPDEYLLDARTMAAALTAFQRDFTGLGICFFGHTHIPILIGGGQVRSRFRETTTVQLDRLTTYLINPGSVGQPRDRCPKAAYGIFDAKEWTMTYGRVEYDVAAARRQVLEADLPAKDADRLVRGT